MTNTIYNGKINESKMQRYRRGHNGMDSKSIVRFVRPWVQIPPVPPFMEPGESGIRKAALSGMPVACRNRRGFSAEKESHPHYQITGFSRSSGRGISYYRWGSKFILRSSKSHPLRQRAPLCTHSSFPKTFVTALTLRIGKKRSYYQITAAFHISGGRGSNLYEIEKPRRLVSVSSAFFRFF